MGTNDHDLLLIPDTHTVDRAARSNVTITGDYSDGLLATLKVEEVTIATATDSATRLMSYEPCVIAAPDVIRNPVSDGRMPPASRQASTITDRASVSVGTTLRM